MKKNIPYLLLLFVLLSKVQAQKNDYFEFQIQDPSTVRLTDPELKKFHEQTWYLTHSIDNEIPSKIDTTRYGYGYTYEFGWNGEIGNSVEFRLIDNRYILIQVRKNKKYGYLDQLDGLYSIAKFNDSSMILVKNYRSDYKWTTTYFLTDSAGFVEEQQKYKKILTLNEEFVKREDSIRTQKNAVWIQLEKAKRDSLRISETSLRKYTPEQTFVIESTTESKGQMGKVLKNIRVNENDFWNLYRTEQKYYINTAGFQQFLKNAGYTEKLWRIYK